jgi:hypothetical protein
MNRRSIFSSLSSMFVAAIVWPRNAEAEFGAAKTIKETNTIKVKNARVIEGGIIVPGQYPLNVSAYSSAAKTLGSGEVGVYETKTEKSVLATVIYAAIVSDASKKNALTVDQAKGSTLYYLAYSDGPTAAPTITQAPPGVKF